MPILHSLPQLVSDEPVVPTPPETICQMLRRVDEFLIRVFASDTEWRPCRIGDVLERLQLVAVETGLRLITVPVSFGSTRCQTAHWSFGGDDRADILNCWDSHKDVMIDMEFNEVEIVLMSTTGFGAAVSLHLNPYNGRLQAGVHTLNVITQMDGYRAIHYTKDYNDGLLVLDYEIKASPCGDRCGLLDWIGTLPSHGLDETMRGVLREYIYYSA